MTDILKINRSGQTNLNPDRDWTSLNPAEELTPPPASNFFEFREVCKAFDERLVLDHVSFTVKHGETCVIMGRSGVGKSVSLKHIMGFLKADSGQVIVDGEDVTNYTEDEFAEVRRKVTMVFQSGALFDSLTVRENISFPLDGQPGLTFEDIEEYVTKIAHMLELENVLDKLPSELSTGMKRAVAIGRAFAQNPEAILYDEPTTMVDPIMAGHMGDLILRLKGAFHKTSIVVTHDTHLAKKLADVVVFLQEGRVAFFGPWDDFENSTNPFLKNFRMQDELIPALDVTL
ncbi:MAG TPA: ATP-binding cassette domain-containing protein [Candidatus Acidoferrum sp.]|jgi:phospholipid/cholesterol/gamma-HCH transport system ATP-binding protein|nr:ATP-binding cassette domain-containing protein [Candidatus Acidoferrum sp.]